MSGSASENVSQDRMMLPRADKIAKFRARLLRWYRMYGRELPWRDPGQSLYGQVISECLLQRTRAEMVSDAFPRFVSKYPNWEARASAGENELGEILRPLGLWKRRAISLRALAREMVARRGRFPSSREEIENLPGVGQYICNAILVFAHSEPAPLLDTNMARVLERVFGKRKLADIRYDPYLQRLAATVVESRKRAEINWAILDVASSICKIRNPRCPECPARRLCKWARVHGGARVA